MFRMFRNFIFFLFALASCTGNSQRINTPKEFINHTTAEDSLYSNDSIAIMQVLESKMKNHQASFYSKEYFDSTKLLIDTIMYDSSKNKMAVFVLAENPITRQSGPQKDYKVYYNAYCYLAKRNNNQAEAVTLKWFNVFYPINFYNKQEIKYAIRNLYFYELATIIGGDDQPVYKYNLDDKRFWDGPGWAKIFD